MATGYYNRVYDTTVSGAALFSALSTGDVRAMEFEALTSNPPAVSISGNTSLSTEQWNQAVIGTQRINCAVAGGINVGADTVAVAQNYVTLFNLQSTNDVRVLRFHCGDSTADCNLLNSSGTKVNVQIALDGSVAGGGSVLLFDVSEVPGKASAGKIGCERIVLVSSSNLSSGAQVVLFNALSYSV